QTDYQTIVLRQDDGTMELRIHHENGPARWALWGGLHRELGEAFHEIAKNRDICALIITGTGDRFCADFDMEGEHLPEMAAETWDVIYREGRALLQNLLAIEVPIIAAVNAPAFIHAEIAMLADILLASDTAVFADKAHAIAGVVPGAGVHML